jgi:hypothetical protein
MRCGKDLRAYLEPPRACPACKSTAWARPPWTQRSYRYRFQALGVGESITYPWRRDARGQRDPVANRGQVQCVDRAARTQGVQVRIEPTAAGLRVVRVG